MYNDRLYNQDEIEGLIEFPEVSNQGASLR